VIFAGLIFAFTLWKELKEDYIENQIFGLSFMVFFGVATGYIVSKYIYPGFWFWTTLAGGVTGFVLALKKIGIKFLDIIDPFTLASIHSSVILLLGNLFLTKWDWRYLYLTVVLIILSLIYVFLKKNYKSFVWYKSGKVGFAGLAVIGIIFVTRTIIAVLSPDMLSFVGWADSILSASVALISFAALYKISKVK